MTLSRNGRYLFVVNAQSNRVSTFSLAGSDASLVSVVDSGGPMPTTVVEDDGLVYMFNAGTN